MNLPDKYFVPDGCRIQLSQFTDHARSREQMNPAPDSPEQQGKPGYMKYAEPRRINEIANQNLTTNQKVGSSSFSGRATFFELTSSSKLNAMFFRAEPNDNGTDHKNGQGEKAHGAPI